MPTYTADAQEARRRNLHPQTCSVPSPVGPRHPTPLSQRSGNANANASRAQGRQPATGTGFSNPTRRRGAGRCCVAVYSLLNTPSVPSDQSSVKAPPIYPATVMAARTYDSTVRRRGTAGLKLGHLREPAIISPEADSGNRIAGILNLNLYVAQTQPENTHTHTHIHKSPKGKKNERSMPFPLNYTPC